MAEEQRDTWKQNKPANQETEYPQNQSYHSHHKDLILEEFSEALEWILRQLCHRGQPIKGTNSRRHQWNIYCWLEELNQLIVIMMDKNHVLLQLIEETIKQLNQTATAIQPKDAK